ALKMCNSFVRIRQLPCLRCRWFVGDRRSADVGDCAFRILRVIETERHARCCFAAVRENKKCRSAERWRRRSHASWPSTATDGRCAAYQEVVGDRIRSNGFAIPMVHDFRRVFVRKTRRLETVNAAVAFLADEEKIRKIEAVSLRLSVE